jgi:hypothetical protein
MLDQPSSKKKTNILQAAIGLCQITAHRPTKRYTKKITHNSRTNTVKYSRETHNPKRKKTIILPRISHNINSPTLQPRLMRGLLPCSTTLCDSDANLDYDAETKFRQSWRTIRSPQLPSRKENDLSSAGGNRRKEKRGMEGKEVTWQSTLYKELNKEKRNMAFAKW